MNLDRQLEDWSDAWVKYMSKQESPTIFDRWMSLFAIGSAIERKVFLSWEKPIYLNLFLALVAPPGGRKGTAMNPVDPMLRQLGVSIAANKTTQEALILALREASENFQTIDGNIHSFAAMTVFSKELSVFLGFKNLDLMTNLADWYDCEDNWEYSTVGRGKDTVKRLWVNLAGATTPDLLQEAMPSLSFGSGLNSRFIYVYADKSERQIVIFPFKTKKEKVLEEKLYIDLERIHLLTGEIEKDQSYLNEWEQWYPVWAASATDVGRDKTAIANDIKMTGYIERRAMHIHKVACLMSISRSNELVLRAEDFHRALDLLQHTEKRMLKTFEGIGKSQTAGVMAQVMNYIRVRREVEYSEVARQFGYDANVRELSAIISTLEYQRLVRMTRKDWGDGVEIATLEYIGDQ